MDISIIVPVYNVQKYLIRCLESIFKQTFSGKFEVIAIDDGSTDNSLQLLYEYQKNEIRLKIIEHQYNCKLSKARATGIKAAIGEYIMHVDSDDWILPGALAKLYHKCKETNADIIVFNYSIVDNEGNQKIIRKISNTQITTDKNEVQKYFLGTTVNKIVKRDLTKNSIYGEIGINSTEDLLYATELLLRANKICILPDCYYAYFINNESITRTIQPEKLINNQIIILSEIKKIIKQYQANLEVTANILEYIEKSIFLIIFQSGFLNNSKKNYNNELICAFRNFGIMEDKRLNNLNLALGNKYYSILPVFRYFGLKVLCYTFAKKLKQKIT